MKLYNTKRKYPRISLFSKHLSPSKIKTRNFFKQSCKLTSDQKKSRYHRLKSPSKKDHKVFKIKQREEEKEAYLAQLRREAYDDLHAQLQHYNDEFIESMRYMENNPSLSSTESLCSTTSEDSSVQNLIELFEAGSLKDYSQLIEWESYKNPPNYFECQGEYGDLW